MGRTDDVVRIHFASILQEDLNVPAQKEQFLIRILAYGVYQSFHVRLMKIAQETQCVIIPSDVFALSPTLVMTAGIRVTYKNVSPTTNVLLLMENPSASAMMYRARGNILIIQPNAPTADHVQLVKAVIKMEIVFAAKDICATHDQINALTLTNARS